MHPNEPLIIINPSSGSGRCGREWPKVMRQLNAAGFRFGHRMSERPGHIQQIVAEELAAGRTRLISFGGDGTISAMVNGVMGQHAVPTDAPLLAHLPGGTGNDWGRTYAIPSKVEEWVAMYRRQRVFAHDAGIIDLHTPGGPKRHWFVNIVGMAYDSQVVKVIDEMRLHKSFIQGKMLYQYVILKELIGFSTPMLDVTMDGVTERTPVFNMAIGICRYNGDGMRPCKDADPADGLLDIMLVRDMPRLRVVRDLPLLRSGKLEGHPYISLHRCARMEVRHTATPDLVEADGDSVGHTPATFSVAQRALRFIVNKLPDEA
jgi:diacylglycerol kinase (ATP)